MKRTYTVDLSVSGINRFIGVLGGYKVWLTKKTDELARRLAEMGGEIAEVNFLSAYYDGEEDHKVEVIPAGKMRYKVRASGNAVLFIEFGAGLIGDGHPEAAVNGMGPGTYPPTNPDNPQWDNPDGWFYTAADGTTGHHSHGNPPNMPMYNTVKELEAQLDRVVQEVFKQ